ncbi:hypothetical protein JWJ88_08595 [Paracoccus methylovorus]|uniref:PASTA domain-containing protein n=1 Tax=Paracoccus methylovorus TaxID=2812658 RepID=A0ABX7JEM0_9RHOB|nr:hypothetical protein [Paracoccus methylovorus]QRZ12667.1 hypothetical protein JWJ88_08595 [Paracoccus methylovorus]
MARPRAVSGTDMTRALDALAKAGVAPDRVEIIVEPGRVRIVPFVLVDPPKAQDTLQPKEWPDE